MLKKEWDAESNGKLPQLFRQNCSLGAWICSKRPALGQNTLMRYIYIYIYIYKHSFVVVLFVISRRSWTTAMISDRRRPKTGDVWFWMIYDGHMITGDEYGSNFLTFVLRLRENSGKKFNQEIDPLGDRTRARCVRSNDVTPMLQRWSTPFETLCHPCN